MAKDKKIPSPKKIKHSITKMPYAITVFIAMIFVVLLSYGSVTFFYNAFFSYYIRQDCDQRLENAVNSWSNMADTFQSTLSVGDSLTDEAIVNSLLHAITSSADVSTDANIVLYKTGAKANEIIWPNKTYSVSATAVAEKVVVAVDIGNPDASVNTTYSLDVDGLSYYYRLLDINYLNSSGEIKELPNYHICVFVNSQYYYSFMESFNLAMWQIVMVAIIAAAIISIIISMPLIMSTVRLSRFSKRISEGNYERFNGKLISREMADLGDTMNSMAAKLEESDREQQTFFQNASHELRTPLQTIQGYAEGLKYDVFDEEGKAAAVDIIIDEASRLTGMVENLLSISKMDMSSKGNYTVKKHNLNSKLLCELVIENIRGNVLHANKELVLDLSKDTVSIYANSGDLLRLFENLFSNCLRYCKKNIFFKYRVEDGNAVYYVMDDGDGISDEVLPHLFARFAKGSDGKHGIGLALCKSIAEEHGGTISGYNLPEGGACFEVRIPANKTESDPVG